MINFDHKARVFNNQALQQKLNHDGFVIVDFLNNHETAALVEYYQTSHPDGVQGFYTSTFSKDVNYRKAVDAFIQSKMKRGLEVYFFDYRVHCGSFIVKAPGEKSVLKMHQDMTLVDESAYTGINIWIPLVDLTHLNGAIEVLPRSHRLFKTYRGASLPDIYDGIEDKVHRVMQPCFLKAGQAIIFDQSIIHYSPANRSNMPRPVINTFITHKNATMQICYWDKQSAAEIEIFEQAEDFMVNFQNFGHDIFSRPSIGKSIGKVPFDFPKITPALLKSEYGLEEEPAVASVSKKRPFSELFKKIFTGS